MKTWKKGNRETEKWENRKTRNWKNRKTEKQRNREEEQVNRESGKVAQRTKIGQRGKSSPK